MATNLTSASIGRLTIATLAMVVLAVVVLVIRQLSTRPHSYICLFEGSLNGLRLGAAVKYEGVQIGTVDRIDLTLIGDEGQFRHIKAAAFPLPVVVDLDESAIMGRGAGARALQPAELQVLIHEGLRGQLSVENLLTGLLFVDLGFHRNTPVHLFVEPGTGRYPEIPTIATDLERIRENAADALDRLEKVDFDSLAASINGMAFSIKEFASDRQLRDAIDSVDRIVSDPALKTSIHSTEMAIRRVDSAVIAAQPALAKSVSNLDATIRSLEKSSDDLQSALAQVRASSANAQLEISPGSPTISHLEATLDELAEDSRWIDELADHLQRNPGALIRGTDTKN
jgi:paraquat-inducible protein B